MEVHEAEASVHQNINSPWQKSMGVPWRATRSTELSCRTILNRYKVGTDIHKWKGVNCQHALQWISVSRAIAEQCMHEDIEYAYILWVELWHTAVIRTVISTGIKQSCELCRFCEALKWHLLLELILNTTHSKIKFKCWEIDPTDRNNITSKIYTYKC